MQQRSLQQPPPLPEILQNKLDLLEEDVQNVVMLGGGGGGGEGYKMRGRILSRPTGQMGRFPPPPTHTHRPTTTSLTMESQGEAVEPLLYAK